MAVQRLLTRGNGGVDGGWTLAAGATKWQAVQSDDGDTTRLTDSGANKEISFLMDPAVGLFTSVSSVLVGMKCKGTTSGSEPWISGGFRSGASRLYITTGVCPTSYTLSTASSATGIGGAAWTPTLLDSYEGIIFSQTPDDSPTFTITWFYYDVTGGLEEGGFVFPMAGLGPLVALGLGEMGRLAGHLWRAAGLLIEPHELERAWREWRTYRHPRHFFAPASGLWVPA